MLMLRVLAAVLLVGGSGGETWAADKPTSLQEIKPVQRAPLRYPVSAMEKEIIGNATIRIEIDGGGAPISVSILDEFPSAWKFGEAAVTSVKQWRFQEGNPGPYKVTVKFRLEYAPYVDISQLSDFDTIPVAPAPTTYRRPVYPLLAEEKRLEAEVFIVAEVKNGSVGNAAVVKSGDASKDADTVSVFGDPAFFAVKKWRFDDEITGIYKIPVRFTLDGLAKGDFKSQR